MAKCHRIILLTAASNKRQWETMREQWPSDLAISFLGKPFELDHLYHEVAEQMRQLLVENQEAQAG